MRTTAAAIAGLAAAVAVHVAIAPPADAAPARPTVILIVVDDMGLVRPPPNADHLPLGHVTLGEAFAEAGYATGYIGKWHLGVGRYMPSGQGFGFTKAVNNAGQPASYFFPYKDPKWEAVNVPDLEDGRVEL
jgi:arylsulfatase A-like enzyme